MKKTLRAIIFSMALLAVSSCAAYAFDAEMPESGTEKNVSVINADTLAAEVFDPDYGFLISEQDFNASCDPNYINTNFDIFGIVTDTSNVSYHAGVLTSSGAAGGYREFRFQYRDVSGSASKFYPRSGKYTTTFDIRNDSASNDVWRVGSRYLGGSHTGGFGDVWNNEVTAINAEKGTWQPYAISHVFKRNDDLTFTDVSTGTTSAVDERLYQIRLLAHNADSVSIDNVRLWYFPDNAYVLKCGDEYSVHYYESGDFSLDCPEDSENFVTWVSSDGTTLEAYTLIPEAEVAARVLGKTFTAFYQDASLPAMGMAFEGTNNEDANFNIGVVSGDSHVTSVSYAIEDARTAAHVYCENSGWGARFHVLAETPFDANEYTIVQYVYKAVRGQNTAGTDIANSATRLSYWTSSGDAGFATDGVEHKITGNDIAITVDSEWKTLTFDMSAAENWTAAYPWNSTGWIYGISAVPLNEPVLADSYIDSIRVYRKGVLTVTYDTNAPEGATVLKNVAPDTNRGVGTDYYLTSDIPVVEGYRFVGWAYDTETIPYDTFDKIDLYSDTTVYAVWEKDAPASHDEKNQFYDKTIDGKNVNGIRFNASVTDEQYTRAEEIGFIATRKTLLDALEVSEEDFTAENVDSKYYVKGISKSDAQRIERILDVDDATGDVSFAAYTYSSNAAFSAETIVCRPYMLCSGKMLYGASMSAVYNDLCAAN